MLGEKSSEKGNFFQMFQYKTQRRIQDTVKDLRWDILQ